MKLSIVVTHYNEPWETCHTLFDSIQIQQGINFDDLEVIVVNDGEENLIDPVNFKPYSYLIVPLKKEHKGVSAARNYGLEQSSGDYVIFCDIDDAFISLYSLNMVFQKMGTKADTITSNFIEEMKNGDVFGVTRHENDVTFIHGKTFRRQFLIDKNLRFDESLTIHEDGYFISMCLVCSEKREKIETPIYLWKWNDNSVVRRDMNDFVLKTYEHLMRSRRAYVLQMKERGFNEHFKDGIVKCFFDAYYDFQKACFRRKSLATEISVAEKSFKKNLFEFYPLFIERYKEDPVKVATISSMSRNNAIQKGLTIEAESFGQWINHIKEI